MALGKRVTLNGAEVMLVDYLAMVRYRIDQDTGAADRQIGKGDPVEIMRQGFGGELAACRVFNVYPDLSIRPHQGSCDFITTKGTRCDVKTNSRRDGDLLVSPHKKDAEVEIYILVVGKVPDFEVVGWARNHDVFKDDNLTDLGHGPTYLVRREDLTPL